MTEAEWLNCTDPHDMLRFVERHRGRGMQEKQRKQRLFSVACCRLIWPSIVSDRSRGCVEVAERFADGRATGNDLQRAESEASAVWQTDAADDPLFACLLVCRPSDEGLWVCTTTIGAVSKQRRTEASNPFDILGGRKRGACPSEEREQSRFVRCIFGNPFRHFAVEPAWLAWRDGAVGKMAHAAYDDRLLPSGHLDPARLAVLADALEEAGCSDAEVLGHLRGPGPHVRGCWVIDLLLGKE
jgi:hypothetical protein